MERRVARGPVIKGYVLLYRKERFYRKIFLLTKENYLVILESINLTFPKPSKQNTCVEVAFFCIKLIYRHMSYKNTLLVIKNELVSSANCM